MSSSRSIDAWLGTAMSRRSVLAGGLTLLGLPLARLQARGASGPPPRFQTSPFTLGVASGDPSPDGMVLWTRLAPEPLAGGGMAPDAVEVAWDIATDERMQQVVQSGRLGAVPELGHSVHAEIEGLEPDRWYWYRFRSGNAESPVGRTRTMPAPTAPSDRMRFGFVSCQHYESGLFTAYRHMADEDLDLVFHLGDYIYEGAGNPDRLRTHQGGEIITLDDYRNRYAQYRLDEDLQAAHAAFPWVVTWDDHEVDNNYADWVSERHDPRDVFLARRTAAYQAYYEMMPLRRTSIPRGPALQLYRKLSFGSLGAFFVLDTRQYRTDQPCDDRSSPGCAGMNAAWGSLLGDAQERWLHDGLHQSRRRWNVLPQQVMMARVDTRAGADEAYSVDQWPGYERERRRLLEFFGARPAMNPVVLTGDIHTNWVNDLTVNAQDAAEPVVGTEFVCTSISSGGDGSDGAERRAALMSENPAVKYYNAQRGYVRCDMMTGLLRADYRVVEYVTKPGAPITTAASFVVRDGQPGAVPA